MAIRIVHVSELTKRPVRVPKPKKTANNGSPVLPNVCFASGQLVSRA